MLSLRVPHLGLITAIALAAILFCRADVARAQGSDVAAADALFDDGKQLFAHRRFADACARFEASLALLPQLGVQLNLADCYEHLGRTASAWLAFGEAAALARRLADRRWTYARRRQAGLKRRLSRILITMAPSAVPADLAVTRDGVRVSPAAFGVEVPVDPGEHTIEATAPERIPWSMRATVLQDGEVVTVTVPELARDPAPVIKAPAPAAPAAPATSGLGVSVAGPGRRLPTPATWIAASAGVAGLGLGTYFGLAARSLWQQARPGCDRTNACSDAAFAAGERSRRDGEISTAAFAAGSAAIVTGVVLYLRAPREHAHRTRVAPAISSDAVGVAVVGGF